MFEWWNALTVLQQIFYLIAIPSTIILLLQTIMLLFGLGDGHDADHDFGQDTEYDNDYDVNNEIDQQDDFASEQDYDQGAAHVSGLRILTVRGIVAFFAICGWMGVAALDMGAGSLLSTTLAVIAGLGAMVLVAVVIRASLKLQQSGNLDYRNAIGLTGEVYVPIPEGGKGKITLIIQERFREMDATCLDSTIKTGETVKVIGVTKNNILVVTSIN